MNSKTTAWKRIGACLLLTLGVCILGIIAGEIMISQDAPLESVVCIYLLSNVIVSALTPGYAYGILSAFICSFAYSFFVKAPVLSFSEMSPYTLLTYGLMLTISIIICSITSKVKEGETIARRREEINSVLYHLTRDLSVCTTIGQVIELTLINVSDVFHTSCRLLQFNEEGSPHKTFVLLENGLLRDQEPTDLSRDWKEYATRPAEGYYINDHQYEWPLYSPEGRLLAALAIPIEKAKTMSPLELQTVNTMSEAAAIVIDKLLIVARQEKSRLEVSQERYRTNLLRSISHDLRTPLAGISGTAEVLKSMLPPDSQVYGMAESIRKETSWLTTMVQNILSLTRLQSGQVSIKKELMVVEDVIRSAVDKSRFRLPGRPLVESYPDDVLTAEMDSSLITQVIINLIDNASKYSPVDSPIEISLSENKEAGQIVIRVADHGIGLSQAAMEKIFKMFYTTKSTTPGSQRGFGLGLPICDMIMKVHEGSIEAGNRQDGQKGAQFVLFLPEYIPQ